MTRWPGQFRALQQHTSFAIASILMLMAGCNSTGSMSDRGPLPRFDRMIQTYPSIESGRFVVIADFEDPKHAELVSLKNSSDLSRFYLSYRKGRNETGNSGIVFQSASPGDCLVVGNANTNQWYMKRDWRGYDLLLLSLRSASGPANAMVTIKGGPPGSEQLYTTNALLHARWKTLQLDLATIGEKVPIDDIRELTISATTESTPSEIHVDDLLLTGHQRDLQGNSSTTTGELYVRQIGRRWRVGAQTQERAFELTFTNGRISHWIDLISDPHRTKNFAELGQLTPLPISVSPGGQIRDAVIAISNPASTQQRIVEMNAVRTVIETQWNYPAKESSAGDPDPSIRWTYAIYPSGQVYVTTEPSASLMARGSERAGLVVQNASGKSGTFVADIGGEVAASPGTSGGGFAEFRDTDDDALLLFAVRDPSTQMTMTVSQESKEWFVAATIPRSTTSPAIWHCQFFLGAASDVPKTESAARAIDYLRGSTATMQLGNLAESGDPESSQAAYDFGTGSFHIRPEQGRARMQLNGESSPRFSPALSIVGAANRNAWIYVDSVLLKPTAHDLSGNIIAQIPGVLRRNALVEVLLEDK